MRYEHTSELEPRMRSAVAELEGMIRVRYPDARFRVGPSPEDPNVVHLVATVDVEDTEGVMDLVIDRMMELQIEDELPIFVIPVRPRDRALKTLTASRPA